MKRKPLKEMIKRYAIPLLGAALGAAGGYVYHRLIGCQSGACVITGNPVVSAIYGAVMGFLLGTLATPAGKKEEEAHE